MNWKKQKTMETTGKTMEKSSEMENRMRWKNRVKPWKAETKHGKTK